MKSMSDRKMDMTGGKPDSDAFFPEEAQHKILKRPGEIRGMRYPDTEEAVYRDQTQMTTATSSNMPKDNFRH
jgi:hypothetical protein